MFNFRSTLLLALAAFGMGNAYAADVYLQTQSIDKLMPDNTTVKMWVFAQCDTTGFTNCGLAPNAAADAPGARINAAAGESLVFHVQNTLPVPVSLIVPGQKTDYTKVTVGDGQGRTRARSMTVEVASGATEIYTIASPKTGTYIYQSGTAPALQVPMGLYGALVVTDGSEPATDALAVFSEIDPVQNTRVDQAALAGLPMTQSCVSLKDYASSPAIGYPCTIDYKPRHMLVNGGAGLQLSVADTGASVLIRWANAGLKTHTPSIVGLDQDVIAEDGNPYPGQPRKESVIMLAAGGTVDALATIPAGNATLALFDRQPGFRNDSELATALDSGSAFGGITVGTPPAPIVTSKIANDDEYNVIEDTPFSPTGTGVLQNDAITGPPGSHTLTVAVQPQHGTVAFDGPPLGRFTYTPAADFSGHDEFVYNIDGELAHVSLNVSYVNDAPVANADEYASNNTGNTVAVAAPGVLANDSDVDGDAPLYAMIDGTAPAGLVLNADGSFTYNGVAATSFNYFACDDAALTSCSATSVAVNVAAASSPSNIALTVVDENGTDLSGTNFRWTLEEDVTWHPEDTTPLGGTKSQYDVFALNFHKSYMPTIAQGIGAAEFLAVATDPTKHYFVSVLPEDAADESGHNMGGVGFRGSASSINVEVHTTPLETAQISVQIFNDNMPTNGAWDTGETNLGGFAITLEDAGGRYGASAGSLSYNAFGEPLTNALDCFGTFSVDGAGAYVPGSYVPTPAKNGVIISCPTNAYTIAMDMDGQALIKNLYPGKYGVIVTPPEDQVPNWKQTSTIEGTKVIDAWVRAGEPTRFQEFGGAPGFHAFVGFVNPQQQRDNAVAGGMTGGGSVTGAVTNAHMSRPPIQTIFDSGTYDALAHTRAWISVNSAAGTGVSLNSVAANEDGTFNIGNLPDGDYELAIWDVYLDQVLAYKAFTVAGGAAVDVGTVPVFNWFSRSEHIVFQDDGCPDANGVPSNGGIAGNAIKEDCENVLAEQNVNLRWRDGTVYQAFPTDSEGFVPFDQTFPFFHWQVAEIDYARFKPTGVTVEVDAGGDVSTTGNVMSPQQQADGTYSRSELGPALTEGFQGFLGQTNLFQWGKVPWPVGQNGGISGIVYQGITRAENDPRLAAAEPWEPGVAGAKLRLYRKVTKPTATASEGDDLMEGDYTVSMSVGPNNASGTYRAQVGVMDLDQFVPLAEATGTKSPGPQPDAKVRMSIGSGSPFLGAPLAVRSLTSGGVVLGSPTILLNASSLVFVEETATDNWDATPPEGCPGAHPDDALILGPDAPTDKCYDGIRNFNQVRPGVFDGGYAFGITDDPAEMLKPGTYVVEVVPPAGTEILMEEHNNVGYGQSLSQLDIPVLFPTGGDGEFPEPAIVQDTLLDVGLAQPRCVGTLRTVGPHLSLFPGLAEEAPFAGSLRPLCDRKEVVLTDQGQSAADFWVVSQAPIATHFVGMVLDDTATEFSTVAPDFGEKWAPPYVPVSIRRAVDNKEIGRVVSDQHGRYNGLGPSTYSAALPSPSGFSPNMLITCMNDPGPIPDPNNPGQMIVDPHFNPAYGNFCYNMQYMPGTTTYLDTPVLPVSAYAAGFNPPDCAQPAGTPKIRMVESNAGFGPLVGANNGTPATAGNIVTLHSMGLMDVPNPDYQGPVASAGIPATVQRNYGFGASGQVLFDGTPLTIVSWSDDTIQVQAPNLNINDGNKVTGQLDVINGAGVAAESGITLTVTRPGNETTGVIRVPGDQPTIQAAIDAARMDGDSVILVAPGVYNENIVMYKPVKLQGSGAGATILNGLAGFNTNAAQLAWQAKVDCVYGIGAGCTKIVDALPNQADGAAGLLAEEGSLIVVLAPNDPLAGPGRPENRFFGRRARIDGFGITGANVGGGVYVNAYAHLLNISNNDIFSNAGSWSGGIRIGQFNLELVSPQELVGANTYGINQIITIHDNVIRQNGANDGAGGGISLAVGTDRYAISNNYICGNFTLGSGGGIGHLGLSDNGTIDHNKILLNQSFDQQVQQHGGGILIAGEPQANGALGFGSGEVGITENLIQGNQAGAGHGGGIRTQAVNGTDVVNANTPTQTYIINIINNMVVNNVAGYSGAGISMADTINGQVINNTVAHNDSTATVGSLITIGVGTNSSIAQPAGLVTQVHSPALAAALASKNNAWDTRKFFSNPLVRNNILWQNRSFNYFADANGAGLQPVVDGPSCAGNYADLAVLGGAYALNRLQTNMTSTTPGAHPDFLSEYCNGGRVGGIGPIAANPAVDEGGAAWIDVRFGPLAAQGNYHVATTSSAVGLNTGNFPASDIDGEPRPGADGSRTAGADEVDLP